MIENLDNLLEAYKDKGEKALKKEEKDYPSFKEFEAEYCSLINEGNSICSLILKNPDCCDRSTYLILSNTIEGFAQGLKGKFRPLSMVLLLSNKLYKAYKTLMDEAIQKGDDMEYINLNDQLFAFSKKYEYKKNIADILYQKYKNFKQAIEIYQEIEPLVGDDIEFWNNYAELNAEYENYEKRDYCLQQKNISELKKELKKILDEKDYKKAIKINEELFKITNDYFYKKEIANIHAVCYEDVPKAIKMYKELEKVLGNDSNYWFQLSGLYNDRNNFYREVLCIQKAIDIELSEPEVGV